MERTGQVSPEGVTLGRRPGGVWGVSDKDRKRKASRPHFNQEQAVRGNDCCNIIRVDAEAGATAPDPAAQPQRRAAFALA